VAFRQHNSHYPLKCKNGETFGNSAYAAMWKCIVYA